MSDDADIVAALRQDLAQGLSLIHDHLGVGLARLLKRVIWGLLSEHDLQDAYQETLRGFWKRATRPDFRAEDYRGLLQTIARRKGLDALRRRGHRARMAANGDLAELADDLAASQLGNAWQNEMSGAEREELRRALSSIVEQLPPRQKLAARVFLDHFEEFRQRDVYQPLAVALSGVTGQNEHPEAVKTLWRTARAAIAAALHRRGFGLL
jgi:DNA-directed RNA polymerase specialized sigma24 family protein